jgi:hypothetical protein
MIEFELPRQHSPWVFQLFSAFKMNLLGMRWSLSQDCKEKMWMNLVEKYSLNSNGWLRSYGITLPLGKNPFIVYWTFWFSKNEGEQAGNPFILIRDRLVVERRKSRLPCRGRGLGVGSHKSKNVPKEEHLITINSWTPIQWHISTTYFKIAMV